MSSAASKQYDPEIQAAFSGSAAPAAGANTRSYDPEIQAAFADSPTTGGDSSPPTIDRALGAGEAALSAITGVAAGLAGGLTYLGTLATGDTAAAKAVQEETQRKMTYEPRTALGKEYAENVGTAASYLGEKESKVVGPLAAEGGLRQSGSPVVSAISGSLAETLINAPQYLLGLKFKGVEPGLPKFEPPGGPKGPALESAAGDVVRAAAEKQSAGAAGAAPDLTNISPELKQAIVKAGPDADLQALGRHAEAESIGLTGDSGLTEGQATGKQTQLSAERNAKAEFPGFAERFDKQNTGLIDALDTVRQETAPDVVGQNSLRNGQALLDKDKAYDIARRADISAKYKALADANGGNLPVDGVTFTDAADAALRRENKDIFLPSEVRTLMDRARGGGEFTYGNFENLRTILATEARAADRAGKGNAEGAINIVRNALENLPMTERTAPIKALADDARQAAAARFRDIDQDPQYKAAVNDDATKPGEPSPLADSYVQKWILNGNKATLDRFNARHAGDPEVQQRVALAGLDDMRRRAGLDPDKQTGNFSSAGFTKALGEYEPYRGTILDDATMDRLRTIGNVSEYISKEGKGTTTNFSNTWTAAAGRLAKQGARGLGKGAQLAGDLIPMPLGFRVGTSTAAALGSYARKGWAKRSLSPGAGIAPGAPEP